MTLAEIKRSTATVFYVRNDLWSNDYFNGHVFQWGTVGIFKKADLVEAAENDYRIEHALSTNKFYCTVEDPLHGATYDGYEFDEDEGFVQTYFSDEHCNKCGSHVDKNHVCTASLFCWATMTKSHYAYTLTDAPTEEDVCYVANDSGKELLPKRIEDVDANSFICPYISDTLPLIRYKTGDII